MSKIYRVTAIVALLSLVPIIVFASDGQSNECTDPLDCVTYSEGEPIRIATSLALSGPLEYLGIDELRGIELALDQRLVHGHAIELVNYDSMCSYDGGVLAAEAIVQDQTIAAVVGTTCSGAAAGAAPILSDAGYSLVSPSNTAHFLTDPATHFPGYFRTAWNDVNQTRAMAEYVIGEGALNSAVIVDGEASYSTVLGEAFVDAIEALGGTNLAFVIAAPDGSDAAAVIDVIALYGPDVLYMPVFPDLGGPLIIEARANSELDNTTLAASDVLLNSGTPTSNGDCMKGGWRNYPLMSFLNQGQCIRYVQTGVFRGGDAVEGLIFTLPDYSFMGTDAYSEFVNAYYAVYNESPMSPYSAYAYDAINVILEGIEQASVSDGHDTLLIGLQSLRNELSATNFLGLTGTIVCNEYGDCASTEFVIMEVIAGVPVPVP